MFGGEIGLQNMEENTNILMDKRNRYMFEFTDHNSHIIVDNLPTEIGKQVPLSTIFEHETLFKVYPEFRTIQVLFLQKTKDYERAGRDFDFTLIYEERLPKKVRQYKIGILTEQSIISNARGSNGKLSLQSESVLLLTEGIIAELQHAIQLVEFGETEPGMDGATKEFTKLVQEQARNILEAGDDSAIIFSAQYRLRYLMDNREKLIWELYENNFYELVSRESVNRLKLNDDQRKYTPINKNILSDDQNPKINIDRSSIFKGEKDKEKNAE